MNSVENLRRAMAEQTADLFPQRTGEQLVAAGRRRLHRRRTGAIAAACLVAVAAAVPIVVRPGENPPADSAAPADQTMIRTGVPMSNGEELVLWPASDHPLQAGSRDPVTGQVADVEALKITYTERRPNGARFTARPKTGDPSVEEWWLAVAGPNGTIIVASQLRGPAERVTATVNGAPWSKVGFAPWGHDPGTVLYWLTDLPDAAIGEVTGYDSAGKVVGQDVVEVVADRHRPGHG